MDRLVAMSILLAVVEAGSLSAAARQLGKPLATVSRKVAELETHLGARLLNRSSRRIALTEAGQSYVAACRRILEDVEEAERGAAGEYRAPRGELIVTAPIVFGRLHILPILVAFLANYPDIDARIILTDSVVNILEDPVDIAVRIGSLRDSSLVALRVGAIRRVVCGSPDYFATRGTPKVPADLDAHDCITLETLMAPDAWRFSPGEPSVAIHSRLVVNTAEAAIDAAIAGLGITRVLSYQVAGAVHAGDLAVVLQDHEPPASPVTLIHAGRRRIPLKLRAFLDFAAPRLKSAVSALSE